MNEKYKKKYLTLPNLLSFSRLCMIPWFMWLYIGEENFIGTALVLLLSGITDLLDGYIARKFDMMSDFGKALDPVADKLTQGAMMLCLLSRFSLMLMPLVLLAVKEIFCGATSLLAIHKTGEVNGADWHGKVNTCLLYSMMTLHILWPTIPRSVSHASIGVCTAMMLLSFVLYGVNNIREITIPYKKKRM